MKTWAVLVLLTASGLVGCGAGHFQQITGDTLTLYLDKPGAQSVFFHSSLNGFAPIRAHKQGRGWVVSLPSQEPFSYFYMLDGKVYTPGCRLKENDDFGSHNCLFEPGQ